MESSWELDVIKDADHGRWVATLGADAIAELTYRFVGGRVVLLSTGQLDLLTADGAEIEWLDRTPG